MFKEKFQFNKSTPELEAYLKCSEEYMKAWDSELREKLESLRKAAGDIVDEYFREEVKWYCRDSTKTHEKTLKSESGKYDLHISSHQTERGGWSYTKAVVLRDGNVIAEVCRNYSAFPFLFIEGHPMGDFLVCGEDYQGQTVVNLNTGEVKSYLPAEAEQGAGFCWSSYKFDPATSILSVNGCHWACPYEFRFFDFSNPMGGWPELMLLDADGTTTYADDCERWPEVSPDGTIKCYQVGYFDDENGEESEELASISTFKKEGDSLIKVSEWVSEKEKIRREEVRKDQEAFDVWYADFKQNDSLYLELVSLLKKYEFKCENYNGIGYGSERIIHRRILQRQKTQPYTVDMSWGVKTVEIKLVIYKNGKSYDEKCFERSIDGMREAFAYVSKLINV